MGGVQSSLESGVALIGAHARRRDCSTTLPLTAAVAAVLEQQALQVAAAGPIGQVLGAVAPPGTPSRQAAACKGAWVAQVAGHEPPEAAAEHLASIG